MRKIHSLILSTITAMFLVGCGGGGGGSSAGTTTSSTDTSSGSSSTTIYSGSFIDSPVQGLQYSTATQSGTTDQYGTFTYKQGETVTFKIGNVTLGQATGTDMITPLTLAGDTSINNISLKASNIARLIQSLNTNSTDDKVMIPSNLSSMNVNSVNLESEADINTILAMATNITGDTYILKDSVEANSNMSKFINIYSNYSLIVPGKTYANTGTGTVILLLTNKARVSATFTSLEGASAAAWGINRAFSSYSYRINDIDFNVLQTITTSNMDAITLNAGTYLIDLNFLEMGSKLTFTVDYIY